MHILCPHCHNPIELVRITPRQEINCPSCGSSFNLDTGSTGSESTERKTLGKFEILEIVGHGAFGTVYKARDPELDRTVALKVPRAGNLAGPQELDRFLREARSVAQLRHPSIVTVHDVGQADGVPYLVSDFVEGMTLADLLSARKPSFRESAQLAADIADALQYAHDQGVVHRDVKPSNIMLETVGSEQWAVGSKGNSASLPTAHCPLPTVRLMDFGLAKRDAGEITMTMDGQVLGTPAYMSPEQARGEGHDVDGRSDVYSVGVILYQMLTGELPFRGTTRMLLHQVLHDEPRAPRSINDRIPRDLETICLKAMAKEPERRYHAAHGFADDLRRFLNSEPIQARPVGRIERTMRWCRRNRVATALIISLVVGIASTTWVSNWALRERDRADGEARTAEQIAEDEQKERTRAEGLLYASRLALAQKYWDEGNVVAARNTLDDTQEHRADWEHRYLFTLMTQRGQRTFRGHANEVTSVCFSPDGRRLASASVDKTVKVWDVQSGQDLLTFKGHTDMVRSVCFSPDGQRLASAGGGPTVKVWDAQSGKELLTLKSPTFYVSSVCFSPDGRRLASAGNTMVKLWDAQSGLDLLTLDAGADVTSMCFSPDGRRLAAATLDWMVKLWDSQTGQELRTLKGHADRVESVCFSPDGQRLASASFDQTVKVWDAESGQDLLTLKGHNGFVTSVCFSPDGLRLASASEALDPHKPGELKVWDAQSGQNMLTLKGHTRRVASVCFSPDGRQLCSASGDQTVKLWDAHSGQDQLTLTGHIRQVWSVCFSPDGRLLASASGDNTVKVWDAQSRQELLTLRVNTNPAGVGVISVCFSPDGRRLAGRFDQTVKVWDAQSGQELLTLNGQISVCFSPDGRRLATASGKAVKLWDAQSGQELLTLKEHTNGATSACFSPDGRRLASANYDGTVKLWDAQSGQDLLTLQGHTGGVTSVCFSPDGRRLASASEDQTVKLWDTQSGQDLLTLNGHAGGVSSVYFSPDGRRLASASSDQTMKVWDAQSGQDLLTLPAHTSLLSSVCFSPDGRRLASGSGNAIGEAPTVKLWDAQSGQDLLRLKGHTGEVISVCFSPDGRRLASVSWDQTVRLWDVQSGQNLLTLKGNNNIRTSVCFSPDGRRLVSHGFDEKRIVWDIDSGEPVPDATDQLVAPSVRSPDGKFIAEIGGSTIRILPLKPPGEELVEAWCSGNPDYPWHASRAADAETAAHWFAADFHLTGLLEHSPDHAGLHVRRTHARMQLLHEAIRRWFTTMPRAAD